MGSYDQPAGASDAAGMRFGVVAGRFNREITLRLLDGVNAELLRAGVAEADVTVAWVPGAIEIPVAAQRLARSGIVDAVVCVGAVIRGETPHFDYVAGECAAGIVRVGLDTGVPVIFGVLTTDDLDQALERSGGKEGNKGEEAAASAIEMVNLLRRLPPR
jgi:6,7-dimethyl-8-ribityllumazine synthase